MLMCALASLSCATPTIKNEPSMADEFRRGVMREDGPPRRVILITVAGLESADFLNVWGHAAREGDLVRMPNLARLAREGIIGMQAHPPSPGSVYASHATIATGRLPARHGVVADYTLDENGKLSLPFWDSRLLKGTTLWDAAIGLGVLALGWPTTNAARIELVVPDGGPTDGRTSWLEFIGPRSSAMLKDELEKIAAASLSESQKTFGESRDPKTWPTPAERDSALAELACSIVGSERDPRLWLIRFSQSERAQQISGPGSVEVDEALQRVDREIGRIMDCLAMAHQIVDTAILVTGDVRYQSVHTRIDPNVALVRDGLIGRDPRNSTGVRSWLALARSNGRSAYVYAGKAENAIAARKLLEAEGSRTGAFEVVSAAELVAAGGDPQAWFGLSAQPGFMIGNGLVKPVLGPAELRGSAGAFPFRDTESSSVGFVAWGRGIRPQIRVPSLGLVDIAPTIAMLLGLRLDQVLDGSPLIGILRAAVAPPPPGPKRLGVDSDGDVDRAIRELGGSGRELGQDE